MYIIDRCVSTESQCRSRECVPTSKLCDGRPDCRDRSDEGEDFCSKSIRDFFPNPTTPFPPLSSGYHPHHYKSFGLSDLKILFHSELNCETLSNICLLAVSYDFSSDHSRKLTFFQFSHSYLVGD